MRRFRPVGVAVALALIGSACDDATGPEDVVLAIETSPALRLAVDLPSLPGLVRAAARPAAEDRDTGAVGEPDVEAVTDALVLWSAAADAADPLASAELRERAILAAAPALAGRLGAARIEALEARLARVVAVAATAGVDAPDGTLREAASRAAAKLADARGGDLATRVAAVLMAAEILRPTAPRAVAGRLIAAARDRLSERLPRAHAAQGETLLRAVRLLRGAERAYGEGSYERAIQRAFYARLLLASD